MKGDSNEVVITGIELDEDEASAISVFTIDDNHVLVGVAGFPTPKLAMTLFDLSVSKNLPLDFTDDFVEPTRSYQRKIKRADAFDVLKLFEQQRGVSFVLKIGEQKPTICDVHLKEGALEKLEYQDKPTKTETISHLSTLAVDPLGGYLVTISPASNSTSKLIFSQAEGKVIQSFSLELTGVTSLGFTPDSQQLYALVVANETDLDSGSPQAGIYEILSNDEECSAELVLAVDGPQKMKMDAQGNVWVLCKTNAEKSHLLKVTGLNDSRIK